MSAHPGLTATILGGIFIAIALALLIVLLF
jgi:hypothetical protein